MLDKCAVLAQIMLGPRRKRINSDDDRNENFKYATAFSCENSNARDAAIIFKHHSDGAHEMMSVVNYVNSAGQLYFDGHEDKPKSHATLCSQLSVRSCRDSLHMTMLPRHLLTGELVSCIPKHAIG